MRRITRLQLTTNHAIKPPSKYTLVPPSHLHSRSKTPKCKNTKQTHLKSPTESVNYASLFNEITQILGTQDITLGDSRFGSGEEGGLVNGDVSEGSLSCSPPVCGNGEKEVARDDGRGVDDALVRSVSDTEVSGLIHEITKVVRAEDGESSMEERLENAGFCGDLDGDVVEKVLKRCFKVPHLALRFFNWVKLKDWFCPNTAVYNTVLYIAGGVKKFEVVEELLEEMERNSCEKNAKTWTVLVDCYGRAKLVGKALLLFEEMKKNGFKPDDVVYGKILRVLCVARKADISMEYYKEMVREDMRLDLNSYKLLLNCVASVGDAAVAYALVDDMVRMLQLPERMAYGHLLKSFCMCQRITDALELIHNIKNKGLEMEANYCETLVKGLSRAGRVGDAVEILEIMKRRDTVNARAYGSIIQGHLKGNDVSGALHLLKEMKDCGHVPDVSTYTALIQKLFRSNENERAKDLYDEMIESGIEPDSVTIMAMIAVQVSRNNLSEAINFLRAAEGKGTERNRHRTYLFFIKELCKVATGDEILDVMQEMQALKVVMPDELFHRVLFHFKRKGYVEHVEKLKQIQTRSSLGINKAEPLAISTGFGSNPQTEVNDPLQRFQETVDCQLLEPPSSMKNLKNVEEICQILLLPKDLCSIQQSLEECGIKFSPELVLEIMRNRKVHGKIALRFFYWVAKQDGYRHTADTYNMAIKVAGCTKNFSHMRNLFNEMRRNNCLITSHTWTIMIMHYGRTGLTEIALNIFKEMKASGVRPTASCYKYLIMSLCGRKGRKVDDAVKLFCEMTNSVCTPDKELIETYLGCLCETDKLSEARRCVDYLLKVGFTSALGNSLYIRALCRAGKLEEALKIIDEAGTERASLEKNVYGSIIHALLRKGKLNEALSRVDYMKRVGVNPTVHVYTSLISHFFKEKETDKARETIERMQHEGCEPTVITYSALIQGYMNVGNFSKASDVFNQMKARGPSPDFKTYSVYMDCLCRVGRSEEALEILKDMREQGIVPSTINFRTVFFGLNREGKQNLARSVLQEKSTLAKERKFIA